ncbi:MAG: molybdopterin-binding protein, partial [Actinomycetota bacterium]|nr:molybdopterin-binding protein [Actinomycetota bacterium]
MSKSVQKHREASPEKIRVAVLTVSDTRTPETDTGGNVIVELMQGAGHEISHREIVNDDALRIEVVLQELLADAGVDAVITTGGTGISARDTTYEVVSRRIDKKLDGFGELFRVLS